MHKNWNVETFSNFKCYFNFIEENTVRFHFDDEFCVIKLINDQINLIDSKYTTVGGSIQEVVEFYQ